MRPRIRAFHWILAAGVVASAGLPSGASVARPLALTRPAGAPTDPGSGGFEVATDLGGSDAAYAVTFRRNGQIVVAGATTGSWALVAYQLDGSLDQRFGIGGVVLPDFSPLSDVWLNDIGMQARSRILAVGRACDDQHSRCGLVVARYLPDGTPDIEFGREGQRFYAHASAEALAVQRDGRLLTAGSSSSEPGSDFALVRFQRDGRVDRNFGNQGLAVTDFGGTDMAQDVQLQDDGRIVVAGLTDAGGASVFALARYLPDGRLDPTFGDGGKLTTDVGYSGAGAVGVVIQPDGRLVAAGNADDGDQGLWVLVGYLTDGTLDPAFGEGGMAIFDHGGFGTALTGAAGRASGEIVVSGWEGDEGPWGYFIVTWYDAQGAVLDTEYGGFSGEAANYSQGIATHPNGHAAAVGFTADIYGSILDFAVADYPGP